MRITSSVEYATRLMAALGRSSTGPIADCASLSADKLSEAENVPLDYVTQLLARLRRAGLIQSHRGLRGGYSLARTPKEISLGQIVRATEGTIFEGVCGKYDGGARDCRHQAGCGISPVWEGLGRVIEEYLDGISLADLIEKKQAPCARAAEILSILPLTPGGRS